MIRGYYAKSPNLDFGTLEDRGLTHVFAAMGYDLSTNYNTAITGLNEYIEAIETTNLKLYCGVITFKAVNGVDPDPGDPTRTALCASNIEALAEQTDVDGFITDDYVYPNQVGFVSSEIEARNRAALISFSEAITEASHEADPNKLVIASSYGGDYYNSTKIEWFAPYFDILAPEIYRNINNTVKGTPLFGYASHKYVESVLTRYLAKVGDAQVFPQLITYNSDSNPVIRTMQDISGDINFVLKHDVIGYSLYASNHAPNDLSFPSGIIRTFSERTYSTRNYSI
jgi:hypothetical protein